MKGPKEVRLMNYDNIKHLLKDFDWDLHNGSVVSYGDWPVENREEFGRAAAARIPIIREGCKVVSITRLFCKVVGSLVFLNLVKLSENVIYL